MPDCTYISPDIVNLLILCVNGFCILGILGALLIDIEEKFGANKWAVIFLYVIIMALFYGFFTRNLSAYTPENVQTYCESGVSNQP